MQMRLSYLNDCPKPLQKIVNGFLTNYDIEDGIRTLAQHLVAMEENIEQ